MVLTPAALVLGHPGHELRLHGWMEIARPVVFVITDGSGAGRSRVDTTRAVLRGVGAAAGSIMGPFTDAEIYRLMLEGEVEPVVDLTLELADRLVEHGTRSVVADALEWYNPTHDLCSVIAGLAAQRASAAAGRAIPLYDYAVTQAPSRAGETFVLDAAAVARKLAAARRYEELRDEVRGLIARIGVDALAREVLEPLTAPLDPPRPSAKPFYEVHGEQRVAQGRYAKVIRYEQHFRPFVAELAGRVQALPLPAAQAS